MSLVVVVSGSHLVILINIIQRHCKVQSNICRVYFTMVHWFYRRSHFYTFSSYWFYAKRLMFCGGHLWFLINTKYKTNLEEGPCKVQLNELICHISLCTKCDTTKWVVLTPICFVGSYVICIYWLSTRFP
jgi:hypothetical protein